MVSKFFPNTKRVLANLKYGSAIQKKVVINLVEKFVVHKYPFSAYHAHNNKYSHGIKTQQGSLDY